MTLGTRLAALRKARGLTQEQLAEMLNVTRQAVSKWEGDLTYPETEKLIRLSELYGCTLDSLIFGSKQNESASAPEDAPAQNNALALLRRLFRDRKSKKMVHGVPLWHIGLHARGIIAIGPDAYGVLAIGLLARGAFPIGLLALGLFPFGTLAIGFWASGALALGIVSMGAVCAGIISAGSISFGAMSFGAIACGGYSVGALSIAKYAALGDNARGMIALGQSEAHGSMLSFTGALTPQQADAVRAALDETAPALLHWAKAVFKLFLR